jgi:hypothetical protein
MKRNGAPGVEALMNLMPDIIGDYAQLRHLNDKPFLRRIKFWHSLGCIRILQEALSIVDETTKVRFVP